MLEMFSSIINGDLTLITYLKCTAASLAFGVMIAFIYTRWNKYFTQSFITTLILLPAIVQTVIMLVNGNVGTGIAVAGAFSLVRFRSVPGRAKDIAIIFLAMAAGLATGTGYILLAAIFTFILCAAILIINILYSYSSKSLEKQLKITIPENLDYTEIFDDLFDEYTKTIRLEKVKTVNMGSLYCLEYSVILNDENKEKEFIDKIRCRNGNLEIVLCQSPVDEQL